MTTTEKPATVADLVRIRALRERAADEVEADVVDVEEAEYEAEGDAEEYDEPDYLQPSRARQLVVSVTGRPVPTRRQLVASIRWWTRQIRRLIPWIPVIVLREIRPIIRGIARTASRWAAWVHCAELAEAIQEAKENERSKAAERLAKRRSARAWGSVVALGVAGIGMTWLWFVEPAGFALACVALVCIFDAVGRRGQPRDENPLPIAAPSVLTEGVPLAQITASILATFEREGFEPGTVAIASPLTWDEARKEYRVKIKTADEIRREHVRAIERAIGARDGAIRNLATGTASVRELVIPVGDPLARTPLPEFYETGALSITQPLDLGISAGDVPFAVTFAGVHAAIVGATGSGKTKGLIWVIIDRLSACRDAVIWGIDLAAGPALPMWRGVIQRKAFTVDEADDLLARALAEIDRRMRVLTALAEDDDPDNDADEWHPGLGPALVIIVDEFALLADYDGKAGRADLLGKVEQIIRTGRKVWVTLILGTQKTGNSDFGSSVMSTQVGIKILLACSERDTVVLFGTERRDQGWAPHLLAPSVEGDVRDAGKCYVESPAHKTPDIYRTYAPLAPGEVKRRARQRMDDGLPTLDGRPSNVVDAVEVPPTLAAVERAFAKAGNPDRIATAELLAWLREDGLDLDASSLADQLRPTGLRPRDERWRPAPKANPVRGYYLADVRKALQGLS